MSLATNRARKYVSQTFPGSLQSDLEDIPFIAFYAGFTAQAEVRQVEAAAKAVYETECGFSDTPKPKWKRLSKEAKRRYREMAKAAFAADLRVRTE